LPPVCSSLERWCATGPTFTLDFTAVLSQASEIFTSLGPVLVGVIGIAYGFKILGRVKGLAK
jgi:hypothetical protein